MPSVYNSVLTSQEQAFFSSSLFFFFSLFEKFSKDMTATEVPWLWVFLRGPPPHPHLAFSFYWEPSQSRSTFTWRVFLFPVILSVFQVSSLLHDSCLEFFIVCFFFFVFFFFVFFFFFFFLFFFFFFFLISFCPTFSRPTFPVPLISYRSLYIFKPRSRSSSPLSGATNTEVSRR